MANFWTNMIDSGVNYVVGKIAPFLQDAMSKAQVVQANYYQGNHRPTLKIKPGQVDDNITINFSGLAIDRSVSRLFKGGLEFVLPQGSDAQFEYLKKVWDLNKKEIILYQAGLHGSVYGTGYFKVCPDELIDPFTGKLYPRLIATDPEIIRIVTKPQDMNEVLYYKIEYQVGNKNYREITRRSVEGEAINDEILDNETWVIEEWEQTTAGGNLWVLISSAAWPYNFPPIIHWKNLPSLKSCYGKGDIDDAIGVQDKENFVVSNTGKIIKFHAHPQTIGIGFSVDQAKPVENAVGSFTAISSADAKVFNLEMQSDLASSRSFALDLRQSIFDIAREVDISSMADRLGQLTNFGLQVLWGDAIDKNDTKRQLYGDAILELNRRLLVLAGYEKEASNPGALQWGNPLPVDVVSEMQADQMAINMGIIDKETISKKYKYRYGQDWETIQAKLAEQNLAANQNNSDIGSLILRNFNNGVKNSG